MTEELKRAILDVNPDIGTITTLIQGVVAAPADPGSAPDPGLVLLLNSRFLTELEREIINLQKTKKLQDSEIEKLVAAQRTLNDKIQKHKLAIADFETVIRISQEFLCAAAAAKITRQKIDLNGEAIPAAMQATVASFNDTIHTTTDDNRKLTINLQELQRQLTKTEEEISQATSLKDKTVAEIDRQTVANATETKDRREKGFPQTYTLLSYAIESSNTLLLEALLTAGIDPTTAIESIVLKKPNEQLLEALLTHIRPLYAGAAAANAGNVELAKKLLINAIKYGKADIVSTILKTHTDLKSDSDLAVNVIQVAAKEIGERHQPGPGPATAGGAAKASGTATAGGAAKASGAATAAGAAKASGAATAAGAAKASGGGAGLLTPSEVASDATLNAFHAFLDAIDTDEFISAIHQLTQQGAQRSITDEPKDLYTIFNAATNEAINLPLALRMTVKGFTPYPVSCVNRKIGAAIQNQSLLQPTEDRYSEDGAQLALCIATKCCNIFVKKDAGQALEKAVRTLLYLEPQDDYTTNTPFIETLRQLISKIIDNVSRNYVHGQVDQSFAESNRAAINVLLKAHDVEHSREDIETSILGQTIKLCFLTPAVPPHAQAPYPEGEGGGAAMAQPTSASGALPTPNSIAIITDQILLSLGVACGASAEAMTLARKQLEHDLNGVNRRYQNGYFTPAEANNDASSACRTMQARATAANNATAEAKELLDQTQALKNLLARYNSIAESAAASAAESNPTFTPGLLQLIDGIDGSVRTAQYKNNVQHEKGQQTYGRSERTHYVSYKQRTGDEYYTLYPEPGRIDIIKSRIRSIIKLVKLESARACADLIPNTYSDIVAKLIIAYNARLQELNEQFNVFGKQAMTPSFEDQFQKARLLLKLINLLSNPPGNLAAELIELETEANTKCKAGYAGQSKAWLAKQHGAVDLSSTQTIVCWAVAKVGSIMSPKPPGALPSKAKGFGRAAAACAGATMEQQPNQQVQELQAALALSEARAEAAEAEVRSIMRSQPSAPPQTQTAVGGAAAVPVAKPVPSFHGGAGKESPMEQQLLRQVEELQKELASSQEKLAEAGLVARKQ